MPPPNMRVFNPTTTPQFVTLSFYAQNSTGAPQITSMTINPGEIKNAIGRARKATDFHAPRPEQPRDG